MDNTPPVTFVIPSVNVAALRDKIVKLNRRAKRLGCDPIILKIGTEYVAEKTHEAKAVWVKCHNVTVTGKRPQLPGGWSLVARIQLLDGVTILHTVPGETVPREYHEVGNRCDHCGVNRQRNDVFVVHGAQLTEKHSRYMVVGRTCIADFLGGISPSQLGWYAESLHALDLREFESFGGGGYRLEMDIERYITCSATAIRVAGWVSKKAVQERGGGYSTADMAKDIYHGKLYRGTNGEPTSQSTTRYGTSNERMISTNSDEAEAEKAIAWACKIDPEQANDYLINVHKVADLSYAPWNLSGIAASIVSAYQREQGRLATAKPSDPSGQVIGRIGERLIVTLTVERINTIETIYGRTNIHMFRDENGNVVKWFASKESLVIGQTYRVTGTVKTHGEYHGMAETVLTRCLTAKRSVSAFGGSKAVVER